MDRSSIKNLLPDYVRGRLSAEETKRVAAALTADAALAREWEKWREYFASMKGLPALKAPPGFSLKVMRNIGVKSGKRSLAERLFKPLHVKLPLEAASVIATVIVIVVLYHPFEKQVMPPASQIAMTEKNTPTGVMEEKTAPQPAVQPSVPNRSIMPELKKTAARSPVREAPASTDMDRVAESKSVPAAPATASASPEEPITMTLELAMVEPAMTEPERSAREEMSKPAVSKKAKRATSEYFTDTKSASEGPQTNSMIENTIRAAGGRSLGIEPRVHGDTLKQYTFEIPDSSLPSLAASLRHWGTLTYNSVRSQSTRGVAHIVLVVRETGK